MSTTDAIETPDHRCVCRCDFTGRFKTIDVGAWLDSQGNLRCRGCNCIIPKVD